MSTLQLLLTAAALALPAFASTCDRLAGASLPHTTITTAESVAPGLFTPPYGDAIKDAPEFCRVAGVLKPSADSSIRFEVWMPTNKWNGKFLALGNGGFAGSIDFRAMGGALKRGYATAATDTGHQADGLDGSWGYKHPEKVIDFGYRALHETAATAKQIIHAFYDKPATRSYFDSCSNGGREALMEAQRFPQDFDGILAGAPANYWTHLTSAGIAFSKLMYAHPSGYISAMKIPAIDKAVLQACDSGDGVKDGIISDPERCHFKPATLACKGEETMQCLTAPQLASLEILYGGAKDAAGRLVFPGFVPGAEGGPGGWSHWISGEAPFMSTGSGFLQNYFRYIVYEDPRWTPLTAKIDDAMKAADKKTAKALNATDPDLTPFRTRGGKLILYHGWNDPAISAHNTVDYYNSVAAKLGAAETAKFVRLYMVPGMQHCIGGPGPNVFGQLGAADTKGDHPIYDALEAWVEHDTPPAEIIATKFEATGKGQQAVMTRPLCPYPQLAVYKGVGDTNQATSFTCGNQPKNR